MVNVKHCTKPSGRAGFTLIEIAVVLAILGLVTAMALRITTTLVTGQRAAMNRAKVAALEQAVANFAMVYGRLPCPANGVLASEDANAGVEERGGSGDCTGSQAGGVIPWRTLGISEADATDGYSARITYRAALGLTRTDAMKLVECDPAGTAAASGSAPNQSCRNSCTGASMSACTAPSAIVASRGLEVRNSAGVVLASPASGTGAAYVAISHGENRAGAYSDRGILQTTAGTMGTNESINSAANALQSYYVDADVNSAQDATHFDDLMLRPSIMTVASKAALQPRAH